MAAPRALDLTVTLDAAWRAWGEHLRRRVDAATLSPETRRNYLAYSRRAVEHFGPDRPCDSVEAREVHAWLAEYRTRTFGDHPVGANTMHMCHKALTQLMKYADAERWLRENPMCDVTAPSKPAPHAARPERAALARHELDALIAAARNGHGSAHGDRGNWLRDEIVIRLAGESGLRNAEIRDLDLADIGPSTSGEWVAHVRCGKGRKARAVPVSDACAKAIRDYVEDWRPEPAGSPERCDEHGRVTKADAEALLLTPQRHRFTAHTAGGIVKRCAQAALGRHYVPHGLRHTTGTLLAREAKADPALIAHVLGHSDISVTSIYLDTRSDEASAAVNRRRPGTRTKAPKALPPGPDDPRWPECGTREGWMRHNAEKSPKCTPCRVWRREDLKRVEVRRLTREVADRDRRIHRLTEEVEELRAATGRRRRHGTARTYRWHLLVGQRPCGACEAAHGHSLGSRPECGTVGASRRHRDWGEPLCRTCLDAVAADKHERKGRREARRRGLCAVCEHECALTAAGAVWRHGTCQGGGLPPAELAVPDALLSEWGADQAAASARAAS